MAIDLLVTDRNLNVLGDPVTGWTQLTCELNFNAPAAGTVTMPARPEYVELLQSGNRMVVVRDGEIWCAGPMEIPQEYTWDLGRNSGVGTVDVGFSDDLARVAGYLTYPETGKAFSAQTTTTDVRWKRTTTNAETIIRALVDENCGPSALAARRVEQLVLDTAAGVGTNQTVSTRFEPLLDACRTAAVSDGLGFRTRQVGDQIRFGVYAPQDLTGTARFSAGLNNLRSARFTMAGPRATSEMVMGGNDPAQESTPANERAYVEVTSNLHTDWWRVEKLIQESGKTDAEGELSLAGRLAFGNDNPQASLATETVDTEDLRAGRDYGLGDLVAVVLPTDLEIADVVQTIRLEAEPDKGELVTSIIGNSDKTTKRATVWTVRDLSHRLGQIEARG